MEIKPLDLTVKSLLETAFYRIPRFQRPYSWDRENVGDFWEDAILAEDPDYFIGSFVLYRAKGDPDLLFVVDGQQRLTTITILLAAVRDSLHDLGFDSLAGAVQKLVEREDINSELRFVLDSETPYPYLQEQIQKYEEKGAEHAIGPEQEALASAYAFLREKVECAVTSVDADTTISNDKKLDAKKRKLIAIRDGVLRLQLITVQLGAEDDAYLIFETLNTRGKDLTVSDLVKNHLTRLLRPRHRNVDIVKDKWDGLLEDFARSEVDININRFLHHAWLSRHQYTTEKKLFKEIKRSVDKKAARSFLDTLLSDAEIYRQVLDPNSHKWPKQERALAESITALNVFRVVQPVPMLLAILRDYRACALTLKQARKVLQRMEDFHVQFTAVTAQRTGGGTAFMYASSARQLLEAVDKDAKQKVLADFVDKLRERIPSADEFDAGINEIQFSDRNTRSRQLVRYLLRRLDGYVRSGSEPNYETFSIEHLAPQNPADYSQATAEQVGRIGNLLFLPEDLNGDLKNLPPKAKLEKLKGEGFPLDESLKGATEWDDDAIHARTDSLAKLFRESILNV